MQEPIFIYLIRHAEAGKAWHEDPDPGLSEKGKIQAKLLADRLLRALNKEDFQLITSPLLRAKQTAAPFETRTGRRSTIAPYFGEIPSPGIPLTERIDWLRTILPSAVNELEPPLHAWRNAIIDGLQTVEQSTVIFSHFMVINCAVGWIEKADRLVSFRPDYCSITKIRKTHHRFYIDQLGNEMDTLIQ